MTGPQPDGVARSVQPGLEDEVRQLRAMVESLIKKPLRRAGEFFTESFDGAVTFQTGPTYTVPAPDGSPQWITGVRDKNGQARFFLWDPDPNSGGYIQAEWRWDHLGNIVFTTDNNGGWAEPHLPIVLYPRITPPDATIGATWDYMWVNATAAGAEDVAWSGCIGYVSHSRIWVKGTWGGLDGGTGEYKLIVNGVTVGTWTQAGLQTDTRGPFSLLGATSIMSREVSVDLTARRSAGSGRIACQVSHCHQRQT